MRTLVLSVAVTMLATASAHADPPGMTPALEPTAATPAGDATSYRLQTAAADLSAIAVGMVASKSEDHGGQVGAVAVLTYGFGAPLVHLYHHHLDRAGESLALRIGLPLLGGLLGNALGKRQCGPGCDNDSDIAGTAFGVVIGAVAASAIDIGYLSRGEEVTRAPTPSVGPTASVGAAGSVQLGVGGSF
jgi:hypothetical protein